MHLKSVNRVKPLRHDVKSAKGKDIAAEFIDAKKRGLWRVRRRSGLPPDVIDRKTFGGRDERLDKQLEGSIAFALRRSFPRCGDEKFEPELGWRLARGWHPTRLTASVTYWYGNSPLVSANDDGMNEFRRNRLLTNGALSSECFVLFCLLARHRDPRQ
jgi:hypothetical protein